MWSKLKWLGVIWHHRYTGWLKNSKKLCLLISTVSNHLLTLKSILLSVKILEKINLDKIWSLSIIESCGRNTFECEVPTWTQLTVYWGSLSEHRCVNYGNIPSLVETPVGIRSNGHIVRKALMARSRQILIFPRIIASHDLYYSIQRQLLDSET